MKFNLFKKIIHKLASSQYLAEPYEWSDFHEVMGVVFGNKKSSSSPNANKWAE